MMSELNKKINKNPSVKQGFLLVEVIVAMFIFVLMMAASAAIFASAFKSYRGSKNINENLKNAQYTMSLMGKTFRTSSVKFPYILDDDTSTIVVYDYSQSRCIRYEFSGGTLTRALAALAIPENNCDDSTIFGTAAAITSGTVTGSFATVPSKGVDPARTADTSGVLGKVTISMAITNGAGSSASSTANIQTTVSLRDYTKTNVGIDVAL